MKRGVRCGKRTVVAVLADEDLEIRGPVAGGGGSCVERTNWRSDETASDAGDAEANTGERMPFAKDAGEDLGAGERMPFAKGAGEGLGAGERMPFAKSAGGAGGAGTGVRVAPCSLPVLTLPCEVVGPRGVGLRGAAVEERVRMYVDIVGVLKRR